jgi:hypothetical protein
MRVASTREPVALRKDRHLLLALLVGLLASFLTIIAMFLLAFRQAQWPRQRVSWRRRTISPLA